MRGTVAIVGRANVGKSSLFNRIIGERRSITDDASGITRDRIYGTSNWLNQEFNLIDTGGITLTKELFSEEIFAQTSYAIDEADVIIFLVNCRNGVTDEDQYIARLLRKTNKPVVLAINAVDDVSLIDSTYDFYGLGFGQLYPVSALHGIGIGDLLDALINLLPQDKETAFDHNTPRICIIGQPNVGKSTLANTLIGKIRSITSEIAGTTRDSIDTKIKVSGKEYIIIDTAGIRKQGRVYENAEKYSYLRAIRSLERSDVALFIIDPTQDIEEQDKRIAGYVKEYNKACIIVVNKWDLVDKGDKTDVEYTKKIRNNFLFLSYAPIIFLSALNKTKSSQLIQLVDAVYHNYTKHIQTSVLNEVVTDAISLTPPAPFQGNQVKIYYATSADSCPPSIVLFVNEEKYLHFSYLRYLENTIRNSFDFKGTPIKFTIRRKNVYED